jgi:hypothetical protein
LAILRATVGLWVMPDLLGIEVIAELELLVSEAHAKLLLLLLLFQKAENTFCIF